MARFLLRALCLSIGFGGFAVPAGAGTTLADLLEQPVIHCGDARLDRARLAPYYASHAALPLWLEGQAPGSRAHRLRHALENAETEGLDSLRYHVEEIRLHWLPAQTDACLDLLLTDAFDRFSRELRRGRVGPHEADPSWELRPDAFDPVANLQDARTERAFTVLLESLAPRYPGYARLRDALAQYRRIAGQGGWSPLPPGPALKPGDRHAQVPALRARLRAEGDLPRLALSFGNRVDAALAGAVRAFQRRHGLSPDGVAGPRTRDALNVPVQVRIAQLQRAMERLRWLPHDPGRHFVQINTAGFELEVIEDGKTVLKMRTINGTPREATPSFGGTLQSLVINPYWHVPARIARDRLWPRIRRDPGYLDRNGFRIIDRRNGWRELPLSPRIWSMLEQDNGLLLRQDPGPKNLMGRLSFVFPNPHDIFLHDTPQRSLFEQATRSFSEGCVRIEDALTLARHTLRTLPEWTEARLRGEIAALRHETLTLPEPIPVYVLYLPAWVDDEGRAQFRDDHYRRESLLASYFPAR